MPALFVRLVLLVAAAKMPLEEAALVAGTSQNLINILSLDIYGSIYSLFLYHVYGVK
jgi:hypothetical protein